MGVRVTLSDVPEVLLTATNSEPQVQDAGLAAKAGTLFGGIEPRFDAVFLFERPTAMRYWLMKSEPDEASIDDLAASPTRTLPWTGVRNYQARNFMRDSMQRGDGVLFYHSSCAEPGIAGLAEVASGPYADPTQFDAASPYYDPKSRRDAPRWLLVDVRFVKKLRLIPLGELRAHAALADMRVLARGNRLSITPVTPDQWCYITDTLAEPE
ncbi:putative RNA-binding protein with PUA-like domain [Mycetohabitans endofungorum]|uniref:Putative RNA-binding protein with PUA-like domain n=2 Tax=Burkholderiaceae TaxID=119060 RepID=A0A2P5KE58_9BURK|nr:putative RNA-binding protein with PUA-like domain [Mycetohabitans endofungorum]